MKKARLWHPVKGSSQASLVACICCLAVQLPRVASLLKIENRRLRNMHNWEAVMRGRLFKLYKQGDSASLARAGKNCHSASQTFVEASIDPINWHHYIALTRSDWLCMCEWRPTYALCAPAGVFVSCQHQLALLVWLFLSPALLLQNRLLNRGISYNCLKQLYLVLQNCYWDLHSC